MLSTPHLFPRLNHACAACLTRRPNPWPTLFGYHEVFHGLTIVAGAAHYVLIARYILPLA